MDNYQSQLLLNRHRRAVRFPGFLGGRISGGNGSSKLQVQGGVGDCALFDFTSGLFAVSDGSDRDPSASRHFMLMFSKILKQLMRAPAGTIFSSAEISAIKEILAAESERLLCSMPFGAGCTFTGVLLLRMAEGVASIVMHTGDSLLINCDLSNSEACQFTRDNFWLVGRSQRFFQIEMLPVSCSTRLVLATDGLRGLSFPAAPDRDKYFIDLLKKYGPEEIPDMILIDDGPPAPGRDDASLIVINPFALVYLPHCVMLGGTDLHEESLFKEERSRGVMADKYAPVSSSDKFLTV